LSSNIFLYFIVTTRVYIHSHTPHTCTHFPDIFSLEILSFSVFPRGSHYEGVITHTLVSLIAFFPPYMYFSCPAAEATLHIHVKKALWWFLCDNRPTACPQINIFLVRRVPINVIRERTESILGVIFLIISEAMRPGNYK